jgi:hypothetical protein
VWFGGSPRDFGAPDGSEISNKDSILQEIDEALGVSKPPDIEYIFVEPYSDFSLAGIGIGRNPYGHAALRYTLPSGEQILMNIVGVPGRQMVNFLDPVEYLYGTGFFEEGAEQRGVYNRTMVSVRIEQVEPEKNSGNAQIFPGITKKKVPSQRRSLVCCCRQCLSFCRRGSHSRFRRKATAPCILLADLRRGASPPMSACGLKLFGWVYLKIMGQKIRRTCTWCATGGCGTPVGPMETTRRRFPPSPRFSPGAISGISTLNALPILLSKCQQEQQERRYVCGNLRRGPHSLNTIATR